MTRKKLYTILISLLLIWGSLQAQFDAESFDQLSTSRGLSSAVVTCMMKDSKGFMWFGTQNGLNRYDGYDFTVYRHADTLVHSISGNFILSLFEDSDGKIWVGTENNGLNRYNRQKDRFDPFRADPEVPEVLKNSSVRDFLQDKQGMLYIATDKGIYTYSEETKRFNLLIIESNDNNLHELPVSDLFLDDRDESLWVGTSNGLYHYYPNRNSLVAYTHDPRNESSLSNNLINVIHRTSQGSLYIGTNLGLNRFNDSLQVFSRFYYNPGDAFSEAKSEVQALAEDRRGHLWVGSFGGGLVKINEETGQAATFVNNPDVEYSLSNDYVYSLFYDDAGILWIGTYGGGINKIDQVKIRFDHLEALDNTENALPSNDVYSILPLQDAVLYGTDKGLAWWDRESNTFLDQSAIPVNGSLEDNEIYCLLEGKDNTIWVGTAEHGVFKFPGEKNGDETRQPIRFSEEAPGPQQLISDQILCMNQVGEDTWIGTLNGISVIRNEKVVTNFQNDVTDSTSLADNEVYSIYTDQAGNTWVGTFLGLNKFRPADSSFILYDNLLGNGEEVNSIYCIFQDSQGYLWVGTDNSGLIKFDPASGKLLGHFTKKENLPDNVIYGILEDDDRNLWLSSNNGLIKAIRQGGSHNLTFIHYSKANWLQADSYNIGAFAHGPDGMLYFGSFEGVTYFHPENVKGNSYNPPVYITDFQLFFEPVPISDDNSSPLSAHISETPSIKLSYQQNVLRFRFAALNFIQSEKNSYAFWMENLEDQWNYAGNLREAQYMYIPPGEYIFHVKAANNDGIWNEEGTSLKITITPPFTQTIWFYLIIIVSVSGIVIWVMNIRTRRLRATRARLERQVQLRTQELRKTNKNLEEEIRERQKVQEALAKSEARFRQLIETMNEGFSVQDKEGRINYINPRLCEMFGMTQEEIVGKFPLDFVDDSSPVYREKFIEQMEKGTREGRFSSYELNWKRKDGSIFTAMVSPKPIFDSENNYTGNVAVLTDITDLKNAEKQLITKNIDLNDALEDLRRTQSQLIDSEKMASLGQLTAGVAHEINNPINFVSGNVMPLRRDIQDILAVLKKYDQVIEQYKLGGDFREVDKLKEEIDFDFVLSEIDHLLDGIGEGATRTAEIVKGLRNFSRMDEHELKLANINQGIDSTLLILHNKIKNRISITKDFGDFPDINCYPGQLNQVFLNLLNNAQESIEGEGSITIKTWKEDRHVKISVHDTGRGMSEAVKKKIFDPFFTTKDVGKGTGLGLSISFGIVEKHNGNIEVHSEKGKGTTFTVSIPDNLL